MNDKIILLVEDNSQDEMLTLRALRKIKPVDFGDFAETVVRLGVYWLATNEPPYAGAIP